MKMDNNYTNVITARINRPGLELLAEIHCKTGGTNSAIISCALDYLAQEQLREDFLQYISDHIRFNYRGYHYHK